MITSPLVAPARAKGLPSISRRGSSFAIVCSGGKKIKTDKPYGLKLKLSSEFRLRNVLLIIVEWVSVAEFVWFIIFLFFLSLQGLEVACQSILMHLAGRARSGLVPSS